MMTATQSEQISRFKMSKLDDAGDDDGNKKRVLRRFSRRLVDFLVLNVCASENYLCDTEKLDVSAERYIYIYIYRFYILYIV